MAATSINSPIVGFRVKKDSADEPVHVPVQVTPDDDPLLKRIVNRPDGTLEAVSEKITYYTQEGKKKVYILVSFIAVEGVLNGETVIVERPIEFFFPIGQLSNEHQWISATMRNLSLAARGGFAAQALQDLRKVAWDKGPVRCGTNEYGKPLYHDSEVAAIVWSLQQILNRRGFLDVDGNQVPTRVLANRYLQRPALQTAPVRDEEEVREANPGNPEYEAQDSAFGLDSVGAAKVKSCGECPECGGNLVPMDGCPTCLDGCGYSSCG